MGSKERSRRLTLPIRWVGLAARAVLGAPGRAVRGTARRVADPARQVADYWASERVTVRQGFVAVAIAALTSMIAGLVLAGMDHRIAAVQGLFVLIPASIGMRGNIFGGLAARLGTSIHSGLFEVSFNRSALLFQNIYSATLLTIATSVMIGLLARAIAGLLGIDTISVWGFIAIALVGGILSSAVVLVVTILLSVTSFRRGWDLDSVGAPLITAIGDVVTLPCLFIASFLVEIELVPEIVGGLALIGALVSVIHGWTTALKVARRIVRESFPVLTIAIVLDILAGTVVQPRIEGVFLAFPALLMVLPGFLENTGALGGMLAARLGSKLHLGAIRPRAKPDPVALLDGTIIFALGVTVYLLLALAILGLSEVIGVAHPGPLVFIGLVITGGLLATVLASIIGYYAATITYRFGMDPDNHTIPLVTSGMDLLGVICLLIALLVWGVA
jgi:mgtE-like transporter